MQTEDANRQHYEMPAEMFRFILGPRLKYSCCLYPSGTESLTQAEEAMLRNNDPDYTGNLTAAQKINRARLADGLTEADNFTVQEVRSVLGDKFGTISHTSINAPLETEVYEFQLICNIVVLYVIT